MQGRAVHFVVLSHCLHVGGFRGPTRPIGLPASDACAQSIIQVARPFDQTQPRHDFLEPKTPRAGDTKRFREEDLLLEIVPWQSSQCVAWVQSVSVGSSPELPYLCACPVEERS